jgi:zinc protease
MNIQQKTLKNGLSTLFVHSQGSTAASIQIWFRAGSSLESSKNFGIAHFLEHMFFKGTKSRPGQKIAKDVEKYGSEINAFTSFDYTCYYINSPSSKIIHSAEILLDMVSNPLFKNEDIKTERLVVYEEYKRSIDSPNQYFFQKLQKSFFEGGYSHPILGLEKNILNFNRSQLINFRKKYYNKKNCLFVIAGDIENEKSLLKKIESFNLPDGPETKFEPFKFKKNSKLLLVPFNTKMVEFTLTIIGSAMSSTQAPAEDLAISSLGLGESSRLYSKLIAEDAIANSVSASSLFFSLGSSHFIKFKSTVENFHKAIQEFFTVLKNAISSPLTKEELDKVKNIYVASKVFERESIDSFAFSLGHGFAQENDILSDQKFIEKIGSTQVEDANKTLLLLFNGDIKVSILCPKDADKNELEKLAYENFLDFKTSMEKTILKSKKSSRQNISAKTSQFDPNTKTISLKDGIDLVYRYNNLNPIFSFHAYIKGGLIKENDQNNGIHYLLANTLTKGYSNISYDKLKFDLENRSTSMNGFSGKNSYGLNITSLSQNFENSFDHFFGTLLDPTFAEKYLSIEKELAARALISQTQDPVRLCFEKANQNLYPGHPYGRSQMGKTETHKNIHRTSLASIHQHSIANNQIVLSFSGDIPLEKLLDKIETQISSLPNRPISNTDINKIPAAHTGRTNIELDREQSHIFLGFPGFSSFSHEDLYLKAISAYLSGQSSPLFTEVRDKKSLCYTVQPVHSSAVSGGHWGIYIATSFEKTDDAIIAIDEVLNKIIKKGLSLKEFKELLAMIEGQNSLSLQTNDDYCNAYGFPLLHNKSVDHIYQKNRELLKIKHHQFNEFLKKFLKSKRVEVIVGKN